MEKDLLKDFLAGGWLVAVIGAAGMIVRLLSDDTKATFSSQLKKIIIASVCSIIAWFVLEGLDINSLVKAVIYGVTGVISPEIVQGFVKLGQQFSKNPLNFLRKKK